MYVCMLLCTYMYVHMYESIQCCFSVFTGPPALTVNVIQNIKRSSIVVQWDAVDDSLTTTYTITWTRAGGGLQTATPAEQTSYTITGLTLNTVYTITVSAANMCGSGPEFSTTVSFFEGNTFTLPFLHT